MSSPVRLAFYDLDGTLVSSNVVTQYAFYVKNDPSGLRAALNYTKLLLSVPLWIGLNLYSRRLFNEVFYREYRGMSREWLRELSEELFERVIRPAVYPGAKPLIDADRAQGYRTVLVTGTPDFAAAPIVRYFGFDHVIANSLVFENGVATGEIEPPLIAEREKVAAMAKLCRAAGGDLARAKAYSDSLSDLPMLEAVGLPAAVNSGRRMRRLAVERGWPVLDLRHAPAAIVAAEAQRAPR